MNSSGSWSKVFPGTARGVMDAARWLEALAAEGSFPRDVAFAIQLCVEELFTNAVRHGGGAWVGEAAGQGGSPAPISMSINVSSSDHAVTVVLEDNGKPFNVADALPTPASGDLESTRQGGLGIQLVKSFSSEVAYRHVGGLNRTTLRFLWPPSEFCLL
jgi:anti-sigma regulatory factor (Ser/Thr protein kinase)